MDEKQIKEKIKLAEASVSELQDKSLKQKAFEIVLSHLLRDFWAKRPPEHTFKRRSRRVTLKGRQPAREVEKSQLKFNESQLKELGQFFDKFKPTGTELCVFILANFLRINLKTEKFHEGDIHYCYQQLLSLNTKTRPPAMNSDQTKRALIWLVSPARKKLWLEVNDGIYQISPNGILKFKDLEKQTEIKKSEEKTQ